MQLTKLIEELQACRQDLLERGLLEGDGPEVVTLDECEVVTGVVWSETSEEVLGANAPVYLNVD